MFAQVLINEPWYQSEAEWPSRTSTVRHVESDHRRFENPRSQTFRDLVLAQSILQIGALVVIAFIAGMIVIAGFVGAVFRLWSKFFGPPKLPNPAKPPQDALNSVVVVIGWFGWLSAAGLVTQYSLGWGLVFMAATLMWTPLAPHLVLLLRNKIP